jgi:hypothetical protein
MYFLVATVCATALSKLNVPSELVRVLRLESGMRTPGTAFLTGLAAASSARVTARREALQNMMPTLDTQE